MLATTKTSLSIVSAALAVGVALTGCSGAPDQVASLDTPGSVSLAAESLPALPSPVLAVPSGNRLAFHFDAIGVQIYACQATASGYGWVFQAPDATLYDDQGNIKARHYAGPTWEYKDGSKVVAAKVAGFTADPTAIPELLLKATSHSGDGRMSDVTYIQRLETVGGLAPTSGCDATQVGTAARVDYTATYYFYEADDSSTES